MPILALAETAHGLDPDCGLSKGTVQAAEKRDVDPAETDLRLCPDCFPEKATRDDR